MRRRILMWVLLIASIGANAQVADQVLLQTCQSCHAIYTDDAQGIGPSLVKLMNRPCKLHGNLHG